MSYAVETPSAVAAQRRPLTVRLAAALLVLMGVAGLGYAVATLIVVAGAMDRFRAAGSGTDTTEIDGYVTVVWIGAALGAVLAVLLCALFVVLALGLRRGGQASRVGTWVVCGLGVLLGCLSATTVAVQRSGEGTPGTPGAALSEAYPVPWIPLNLAMSIAQMVGYLAVAVLLALAPGTWFRRTTPSAQPGAYVTLPTYGSTNAYPPPGSHQPAAYPPPGSHQPAAYPPPGSHQPAAYPPPAAPPPAPTPDDDYWARPPG